MEAVADEFVHVAAGQIVRREAATEKAASAHRQVEPA
jgi:hypothetical protein